MTGHLLCSPHHVISQPRPGYGNTKWLSFYIPSEFQVVFMQHKARAAILFELAERNKIECLERDNCRVERGGSSGNHLGRNTAASDLAQGSPVMRVEKEEGGRLEGREN